MSDSRPTNLMVVIALSSIVLNALILIVLFDRLAVTPRDVVIEHHKTRSELSNRITDHAALPAHAEMQDEAARLRDQMLKLSSMMNLLSEQVDADIKAKQPRGDAE